MQDDLGRAPGDPLRLGMEAAFRFSSECDWKLLGGFEQGTVVIKIFVLFYFKRISLASVWKIIDRE